MPLAFSLHTASKSKLLLPAIIALGLGIRWFHLSCQSLWIDELFTRYYPEVFDLRFLWTQGLLEEPTSPLYYTVIAGWMRLFGTSESALRSFSVLASVLVIPLVFRLGREVGDSRIGLTAALLFALSPIQINFAQEARTYALSLIPVTLALLGVAKLLRERDCEAMGGKRQAAGLALYTVGTALAIWCHPTMVFFAAACALTGIAFLLWVQNINRKRAILVWLGVNLLVALLVLPEALAMLSIMRSPFAITWMPPFSFRAVVYALSALVSGYETPIKFPGVELTVALCVVLSLALLATRAEGPARITLAVIPVLSLFIMGAASLVHLVLFPNTILWLGIPLCVAVAYVLVKPTQLRLPMIVITFLVWSVGLGYQLGLENQKEPWRGIIAKIGPDLSVADLVVLAPYASPAGIRYYAPTVGRMKMWRGNRPENIEITTLSERLGVEKVNLDEVADEIRAGKHVWLFARELDLPLLPALLNQVPQPGRRLEGKCGAGICLLALSW